MKVYVKDWNGFKWQYREVKFKKRKFSWRFVLCLVCLVLGLLVGSLV